MNLFVARLSYDTTDDGLRTAFEQFGTVNSARVIMDRDTGRSRGFGFVEMPDDDEANSAKAHHEDGGLNESELDGRFIVVKEANQDENRGGGGGGGQRRSGGGGGGYQRNRGGRDW